MSNTKTLLQRVQSRISKRRNYIREVDYEIEILVIWAALSGLSDEDRKALKEYRAISRLLGVDQRTDKEIFQVLLAQERNKYAGHFRSKYPHWLGDGGMWQRGV